MTPLTHIDFLARGLQGFEGNKSIRLDVKLDDLSVLSHELSEEYGDSILLQPFEAMYVLCLYGINFYFSVKEDEV